MSNALDMLDSWLAWQPGQPPHVLEEDRETFATARSNKATIEFNGWNQAYTSDDFAKPGDTRLHLGLLPHPYCGDLRRASIYILLLNPGLSPMDYFAEYAVPGFREVLMANLRQELDRDHHCPFLFLDPQFAWHSGFDWWHGKLAGVIAELQRSWRVSYAAARRRLGHEIASIELFPYHSANFRDADGWLRRLRSVELAQQFVAGVVVPRVNAGEAIAIATRQTAAWNLPTSSSIVVYSSQQARAAHLSPDSPGGSAIVDHMTDRVHNLD